MDLIVKMSLESQTVRERCEAGEIQHERRREIRPRSQETPEAVYLIGADLHRR